MRRSDIAQGIFLNLSDEDASASFLSKRVLRIPELIQGLLEELLGIPSPAYRLGLLGKLFLGLVHLFLDLALRDPDPVLARIGLL